MQKELTYEDIQIGDTATFSKTISEFDIYQFAGITGDFNPMHINEEFADTTIFEDRIAHGLLTGSFISTVLGMKLPDLTRSICLKVFPLLHLLKLVIRLQQKWK